MWGKYLHLQEVDKLAFYLTFIYSAFPWSFQPTHSCKFCINPPGELSFTWKSSDFLSGCKEVSSYQIFPKLMAQSKMTIERIFRSFLHLTVLLCCFVFTTYQSIQCMIKYQSFPKGTSTKILPSNMIGNNFPAISICPRRTSGLNEKRLKECQIKEG